MTTFLCYDNYAKLGLTAVSAYAAHKMVGPDVLPTAVRNAAGQTVGDTLAPILSQPGMLAAIGVHLACQDTRKTYDDIAPYVTAALISILVARAAF